MRPLPMAMAAAAALAALRGLPFILWPHSAFDSDQAIVGLMAKHLAEGRALPLFYYGQPYMLGVQAWLAAPLFVAGGASIALLKLPLIAINSLIAVLLVWILVRDAELTPLRAFMASSMFAIAPPVPGVQLVAAMGGSVEPFLYVLLIWILRERPLLCGAVAAIGFLHREFTAYGVTAMVMTETLYRWREWRTLLARWLIVGVVIMVGLETARLVRPWGDMFGPDMPKLQGVSTISNLEAVAVRVQCPGGLEIGSNIRWLIESNLPTLAGTTGTTPNPYFADPGLPASPFVWWALCGTLLVCTVRIGLLSLSKDLGIPAVAVFLTLIGIQAVIFYVSRCGVRDPMLIRYTLLTLLIPIAVAAAYLKLEPVTRLRGVVMLLLAGWVVWSLSRYATVVAHYRESPPSSRQVEMARELERRNIRYGYASYWDAHHINFLTQERVVLAPVPRSRIYTYDALVWHAPEKVYIQSTPCPGERIGSLWLCRDVPATPAARPPDPLDAVRFPPLEESEQFRRALEEKYRNGLRRPIVPRAIDSDAALAWTQKYIAYRMTGCAHTPALLRLFMAIDGYGTQPTCGAKVAEAFPSREELVMFRRALDDRLRPSQDGATTAVDAEGEVVWTSEYLRFRLNGCAHLHAVAAVTNQIDGRSAAGC